MKILILTLGLLFSSFSNAKLIKILKATSDDNNDTTYLYVETDAKGKFLNMVEDILKADEEDKNYVYPLKDLMLGVTLLVDEGKDVVNVELAGNFHEVYGGGFTIDYLGNALTGRRAEKSFQLVYENDTWHVERFGVKITRLFIKSNRVFGKTIGIDEIQVLP